MPYAFSWLHSKPRFGSLPPNNNNTSCLLLAATTNSFFVAKYRVSYQAQKINLVIFFVADTLCLFKNSCFSFRIGGMGSFFGRGSSRFCGRFWKNVDLRTRYSSILSLAAKNTVQYLDEEDINFSFSKMAGSCYWQRDWDAWCSRYYYYWFDSASEATMVTSSAGTSGRYTSTDISNMFVSSVVSTSLPILSVSM